MTAHQECRNCRFWRKRAGKNGNCLRFPPVSSTKESWPVVRPSSWCGEYKAIVVEGAEG